MEFSSSLYCVSGHLWSFQHDHNSDHNAFNSTLLEESVVEKDGYDSVDAQYAQRVEVLEKQLGVDSLRFYMHSCLHTY